MRPRDLLTAGAVYLVATSLASCSSVPTAGLGTPTTGSGAPKIASNVYTTPAKNGKYNLLERSEISDNPEFRLLNNEKATKLVCLNGGVALSAKDATGQSGKDVANWKPRQVTDNDHGLCKENPARVPVSNLPITDPNNKKICTYPSIAVPQVHSSGLNADIHLIVQRQPFKNNTCDIQYAEAPIKTGEEGLVLRCDGGKALQAELVTGEFDIDGFSDRQIRKEIKVTEVHNELCRNNPPMLELN